MKPLSGAGACGVLMLSACAPAPQVALRAPQAARTEAPIEVVEGTDCTTGALPSWSYVAASRQLRLAGEDLVFVVPEGWTPRLPQPNLVVLTAPADARGVIPTFELFTSPVCATVDGPALHARIAARAMTRLLPAREVAAQIGAHRWRAGLGGLVGRSIVLFDVALRSPDGLHLFTLYETEYGSSEANAVRATAACPQDKHEEHDMSRCVEDYYAMLKSAEGAKP